MSSPARDSRLAALAAALTVPAFLPVLRNGWVNWDDYQAIRDNPMLRFDGEGLRWMLTTFHLGHWQPLAWLSLACDRVLFGPWAGGYHATALALHAASAALYFLLAREVLARARTEETARSLSIAALFAALLFSVHPLRVESVAWATERRDVLCEVFTLGTLLAYVRGRRGAALGLYALALGSKIFAAAIPAVLLALDYYPLHRLSRRSVVEKWPYALLGGLVVLVGFAAQASTPALMSVASFGLDARLAQAAYATSFYPAKTVFPVGLSAWYGDALEAPLGEALLGAVLLVVVSYAAWRGRRDRPALAAAWACYLAFLLPSSGLVKSAAQLVADRYSYLACLPFPMLAAGAALSLGPQGRRRAGAAGLAAVAALSLLTFRQSGYWRDSVSLWTRACEMNPLSPFPRTSLIFAWLELERPDLALVELGGLQNRPSIDGSSYDGLAARVLNNAGIQLARQGRLEDAETALERALELEPGLEPARENLARTRAALKGKKR